MSNEKRTPETPKAGRSHRATYSSDKKKGGYLIRVEGPNCARFVGREVPVSLRDGTEHPEKLVKLLWSGNDAETGQPVALYSFAPKPRQEEDIPF